MLQVLQDSTLEEIYEGRSLAASIKGGGDRPLQSNREMPAGIVEQQIQQQQQMAPLSIQSYPNQPIVMMVPSGGMASFYPGIHSPEGNQMIQGPVQFVPLQIMPVRIRLLRLLRRIKERPFTAGA